jgi:hypothetical protein
VCEGDCLGHWLTGLLHLLDLLHTDSTGSTGSTGSTTAGCVSIRPQLRAVLGSRLSKSLRLRRGASS